MKRTRDEAAFEKSSNEETGTRTITREPTSLTRSVSPPPTSRHRSKPPSQIKSIAAQIEAGEKDVDDHLTFFSTKIFSSTRPQVFDTPRLDHQSWVKLYNDNANNPQGHHFVIHQHDHPVAGTHYDLRLQCNATSSVSWAIMYGLPGDPNSRRPIRNATETRIHCLWNHLIETASHQTGSLLIWDTGVYEILPYRERSQSSNELTTDEEGDDLNTPQNAVNPQWNSMSEPEKLHQSFQTRRIRIRLHGTKLPVNYTISLWLQSKNNRTEQPAAPKTRRRNRNPNLSKPQSNKITHTTDSKLDTDTDTNRSNDDQPTHNRHKTIPSLHHTESPPPSPTLTHKTNAYPNSTNTIHSIHQRKWHVTLDRPNSNLTRCPDTGKWVSTRGFVPFRVLGRDVERSVVTGRVAAEVLRDEGVVGFVGRRGWRGVAE